MFDSLNRQESKHCESFLSNNNSGQPAVICTWWSIAQLVKKKNTSMFLKLHYLWSSSNNGDTLLFTFQVSRGD
jgi:hypothetical protein